MFFARYKSYFSSSLIDIGFIFQYLGAIYQAVLYFLVFGVLSLSFDIILSLRSSVLATPAVKLLGLAKLTFPSYFRIRSSLLSLLYRSLTNSFTWVPWFLIRSSTSFSVSVTDFCRDDFTVTSLTDEFAVRIYSTWYLFSFAFSSLLGTGVGGISSSF